MSSQELLTPELESLPATMYAHTDPAWPNDPSRWEPLFTPECPALNGGECELCEKLERKHGHLNKVAWWTAKFADAIFAAGSIEAKAAWQWGYLAGLWHDLGKFAPEWQSYLRSKADIHRDEVSGRVDHSTAGAIQAVGTGNILGPIFGYCIASFYNRAFSYFALQGKRTR